MTKHINLGDVTDAIPRVLGLLMTIQMVLERDLDDTDADALNWTLRAAIFDLIDLKANADAALAAEQERARA